MRRSVLQTWDTLLLQHTLRLCMQYRASAHKQRQQTCRACLLLVLQRLPPMGRRSRLLGMSQLPPPKLLPLRLPLPKLPLLKLLPPKLLPLRLLLLRPLPTGLPPPRPLLLLRLVLPWPLLRVSKLPSSCLAVLLRTCRRRLVTCTRQLPIKAWRQALGWEGSGGRLFQWQVRRLAKIHAQSISTACPAWVDVGWHWCSCWGCCAGMAMEASAHNNCKAAHQLAEQASRRIQEVRASC